MLKVSTDTETVAGFGCFYVTTTKTWRLFGLAVRRNVEIIRHPAVPK